MPTGVYRPQGSSFYWISYKDASGIRRRESTKTANLTEAKAIREDRLAAVRAGKLVFDIPGYKKVIPFREFAFAAILARATSRFGGYTKEDVEAFLGGDPQRLRSLETELRLAKQRGEKPRFKFKSTRTYLSRAAKLLECFGDRDVLSLDPAAISKHVETRKKEVSGASINRELSVLSNIFGWGMDVEQYQKLPLKNPYRRKLHQQPDSEPKIRYWSREERENYLKACAEMDGQLCIASQTVAAISELCWTTGMRIEEVLGLRTQQVRCDIGRIELRGVQTKNGKPRSVPMVTPHLKALLEQACGRGGELVFEHDGRQIDYHAFYRAFKKVVKKAGLKNVNVHSFRKTAAVDLAVNGRDPIGVMAVLGHKDFRTSLRYLDPGLVDDLRNAKAVTI